MGKWMCRVCGAGRRETGTEAARLMVTIIVTGLATVDERGRFQPHARFGASGSVNADGRPRILRNSRSGCQGQWILRRGQATSEQTTMMLSYGRLRLPPG